LAAVPSQGLLRTVTATGQRWTDRLYFANALCLHGLSCPDCASPLISADDACSASRLNHPHRCPAGPGSTLHCSRRWQ
jgi:hypothetical protein